MKIADSSIQLASLHHYQERHLQRESLTMWRGGEQPRVAADERSPGERSDSIRRLRQALADRVELSAAAAKVKQRSVQPAQVEAGEEEEMLGDLNMRLLREMFERLTGRRFRVIDPLRLSQGEAAAAPAAEAGETQSADQGGGGFGLVYQYNESHYERERLDFAASGSITTSDGQAIDFSLSLSMSREFYQEQKVELRAGEALKDPLVINFSGTAAQLTQRSFSFDIDADGSADQIAFVSPESGFLALDGNNDGIINDGSELFGALSGNGFADLRQYDLDANGWIDENDAVYDRLRIWTKDGEGRDQLLSLGMAGVGAFYLGAIETAFAFKDEANNQLGQLRQTGLAVMESGRVTTMQQIDLVA